MGFVLRGHALLDQLHILTVGPAGLAALLVGPTAQLEPGLGIGAPGGGGHLVVTGVYVGHMGRAVVELKLDLYAQSLLPHLLDQLGIGSGIGSGGAPGKLYGEGRRIAAQPGFFHTGDKQGFRIGILVLKLADDVSGSFSEVQRTYIAFIGDQACCHSAGAAGDDLGHGFSVKRQRERQTDLLIREHGIFTVEHDHEGTGSTHLLAGEVAVGRELVDIVDIGDADVIQGTILKGRHHGVHILHNMGGVLGELYRIGFPILVVLFKDQGAAVIPLLEHEGTAADDLIRIGTVLIAILFRIILAAGKDIGVGQKAGIRIAQGDDQSLIIGSSHAQSVGCGSTAEYIFKPGNAVHIGSQRPCVSGVCLTLERIQIIPCYYGLPITPTIVSEMESIGKTVFRDLPAFGTCTGDHTILHPSQRLQNVVHDAAAVGIQKLGHIQGRGLALEQHIQVTVCIGILNVRLLRLGLLSGGGFGRLGFIGRGLVPPGLGLVLCAAGKSGSHQQHHQQQREVLLDLFHYLFPFCFLFVL